MKLQELVRDAKIPKLTEVEVTQLYTCIEINETVHNFVHFEDMKITLVKKFFGKRVKHFPSKTKKGLKKGMLTPFTFNLNIIVLIKSNK